MSETVLDLKGLSCPLPVLRANKVLRSLAPGARLRVLATDPASVKDFHAYCEQTGHALVAMSQDRETFTFVIQRKADPPGKAEP
ncbi:sulfurtransferase TusA family protein [Elioraea tepida]|jgi:tRNA 2-thiouridine synthesizing protein A|uniref:Sulfurtransferase TusA family protein n=1 Tax=Elioraea tepida TaxID=2843330 RepID=A0A975YJ21_9PROT|nr:sulfurtransferase TusA family protein [Elioraea tepida]QXM23993.1 sulfurtransferase TusA family protein [Elioraea tepida]